MVVLEDASSSHPALQLLFKSAMCQPTEFSLRVTSFMSIQIKMKEA